MVQFGSHLEQHSNKDWEEYYIDYKGLKRQLKALKAAYDEASHARYDQTRNASTSWDSPLELLKNSPPPAAGAATEGSGSVGAGGGSSPASISLTGVHSRLARRRFSSRYSLLVGDDVEVLEEKFSGTLDAEVEKVVLFFLAKQGELAKLLLHARQGAHEGILTWGGSGSGAVVELGGGAATEETRVRGPSSAASPGKDKHSLYCAVGREIAELMRFLQLNVSGLRKILKKHDKQVRDKMIATNYLSTRAQAKYSSMRQLYNNEGIMALVASLRNAFEAVELERLRKNHILRAADVAARAEEDGEAEAGAMRRDTASSAEEMFDSRYQRRLSLRAIRATERTLSEMSSTDGVFAEIAQAQRSLAEAQHLTTSKYLSLQVLLDGSGLATVEEDSERDAARELHRPSAFINLATTFLYMTNYYIVGPTSAEYAAALGGSPAVSGLIIGMTPIAACFSCLLYSWWTNTSFREPLLLCSWMLIFGNLLYGLALSYDAFWMVLIGRMLIGLGGARGVNRRYIADTIPIESRTAYSAAFVAAGAVGMAFGPFASAVMDGVDFTWGKVIFNGLTNPGWIMFVLWVIMGVIIYFHFQEPPHYQSSNASVGSDEDSPTNTPGRAPKAVKDAAVWSSAETGSASASPTSATAYDAVLVEEGTVSLNDRNNGSNAGSYGSTALVSGSSGGSSGVSSGDGGVAKPGTTKWSSREGESAKLLSHAGGGVEGRAAGYQQDDDDDGDGDDEDRREGTWSSLEEGGGEKGGRSRKCGRWGAITPPLGLCLFGYFVNKLITEAVVSSAPVLTQYLFDWSVSEVGVLMAVLGLIVLPVNAIVGRMSMFYEDRVLLQALAILAGVGCVVMVDFSSASPFRFTEAQYIAGVALVFVAMQAHEGVIMSITSKIIPAQLARGTWNSGFLATEAGTFGRFVGDAFITVMGVMTMEWLDFLLFVPSALLVVMMVLGFWTVYPFLQGE